METGLTVFNVFFHECLFGFDLRILFILKNFLGFFILTLFFYRVIFTRFPVLCKLFFLLKIFVYFWPPLILVILPHDISLFVIWRWWRRSCQFLISFLVFILVAFLRPLWAAASIVRLSFLLLHYNSQISNFKLWRRLPYGTFLYGRRSNHFSGRVDSF